MSTRAERTHIERDNIQEGETDAHARPHGHRLWQPVHLISPHPQPGAHRVGDTAAECQRVRSDGVRSSPFANAIEEVLVRFRAPRRDVPHARLPLLL